MTETRSRSPAGPRPGPGGVADGLPQLESGEPLLHRWFAIAVVALIPLGIGVVVWAFASIPQPTISPAERRPPGSDVVSHERGDATLNEVIETEAGPSCAEAVTLVGDESARATTRRALSAACQLLRRGDFAGAAKGLELWAASGGVLRIAVFELTGVVSSSLVEDDAIVIELNAKYQVVPGAHAAPALIHELTHLAHGWPGAELTAEAELAAVQAEHAACELLTFRDAPPRACMDAAELLALEDPLAALADAGYPREGDS